MGKSMQMYDCRKLRPILLKLAEKHKLSYEKVKQVFIEKIDKRAIEDFEKAMQEL